MPTFDAKTTALVLIDLQNGIVTGTREPRSGDAVVAAAKALAGKFRAAGALVVLVRVGWSADFGDALRQPVDAPTARPDGGMPAGWMDFADGLQQPTDVIVQKRNWGAFYGTELDVLLRRRGISTVVIGGIATNFGVDSTARQAWERNYSVVIAEDVCTTVSSAAHDLAVKLIFPRIGRVVQSGGITLD